MTEDKANYTDPPTKEWNDLVASDEYVSSKAAYNAPVQGKVEPDKGRSFIAEDSLTDESDLEHYVNTAGPEYEVANIEADLPYSGGDEAREPEKKGVVDASVFVNETGAAEKEKDDESDSSSTGSTGSDSSDSSTGSTGSTGSDSSTGSSSSSNTPS